MTQPAQQFDEKTLTDIQDAAYNMGVEHCLNLASQHRYNNDAVNATLAVLMVEMEALKKPIQ